MQITGYNNTRFEGKIEAIRLQFLMTNVYYRNNNFTQVF